MKTSLRLIITLLFAAGASLLVRAADIDGKWKSEFDSQVGQQKYLFELKSEGEKLTGKAISERQGQKAEVEIKNGKITKDEVSFTEFPGTN